MQQPGLNGGASERDGAAHLFERHSDAIYRIASGGSGRLRSRGRPASHLPECLAEPEGRFRARRAAPVVYQIAANVCASTLRSQLGGTRLELRDLERSSIAQVEQPEREAVLDLTAAVRDLPDRQRALLLRDWQGLRYDEIATKMAVSGAAGDVALRARNNVGATLERRDWKPKLATWPGRCSWPFGFMTSKSAVASGASHLKMGFLLACGTVAPWSRSVLQVVAFEPEAKGEGAKPPSQAPCCSPTLPIPR